MATINSNNVGQFITNYVSRRMPALLEGNFAMANLVDRELGQELNAAAEGDTINVRLPPTLTSNSLVENGTVTKQNESTGSVQVTLNQHEEVTFEIPDVVRAIMNDDDEYIDQYLEAAMLALAEKIESDIFNQYVALTANTQVGSTTADLTEGVLDTTEKTLFDAKIPGQLQRYLAVTSDQYSVLRQIPRFSEERTIGSGVPIASGTIGRIKDMIVFRSQYVPVVSNVAYNLAFTRPALALVTRGFKPVIPGSGVAVSQVSKNGLTMRLVMSFNPNTLAQMFTVHILYGVAAPRPNFAVRVVSK